MTKNEVLEEVVSDLTIELKNDTDFNQDVLALKAKNAYREIVARKNYSATKYTDDEIAQDIYEQYFSVLTNVTRYDYNQIGVEGESSHSENGIGRGYVDRNTLFGDIYPFVKVFS